MQITSQPLSSRALMLLLVPVPLLASLSLLFSLIRLDILHFVLFELVFIVIVYYEEAEQPQTIPAKQESQFESTQEQNDKEEAVKAVHNQLMDRIPGLKQKFMENIKPILTGELGTWQRVVNTQTPFLQIFQNRAQAFNYLIHAHLNSLPATAFDFLTDIENRPKWDHLIDEARVLERLDKHTRIVYIRMKPFFPTKARELVLLTHVCETTYRNQKALLNVSTSVEHPLAPENDQAVRMTSQLAGQVLVQIDGKRSEMVQLADGDPQGWIPSSVASFVVTNALPSSVKKLDSLVQRLEQKQESDRIRGDTEKSLVDAEKGKFDARKSVAAVPVEDDVWYTPLVSPTALTIITVAAGFALVVLKYARK